MLDPQSPLRLAGGWPPRRGLAIHRAISALCGVWDQARALRWAMLQVGVTDDGGLLGHIADRARWAYCVAP